MSSRALDVSAKKTVDPPKTAEIVTQAGVPPGPRETCLQEILRDRLTASEGGSPEALHLVRMGYEEELAAVIQAVLDELGMPDPPIPAGWFELWFESTVWVVHPALVLARHWNSKRLRSGEAPAMDEGGCS